MVLNTQFVCDGHELEKSGTAWPCVCASACVCVCACMCVPACACACVCVFRALLAKPSTVDTAPWRLPSLNLRQKEALSTISYGYLSYGALGMRYNSPSHVSCWTPWRKSLSRLCVFRLLLFRPLASFFSRVCLFRVFVYARACFAASLLSACVSSQHTLSLRGPRLRASVLFSAHVSLFSAYEPPCRPSLRLRV